jgi:AAA15 family ATPase/GTPase
VFDDTYDLSSLETVEAYIKEHKHLPEVPSAKEMDENGLNLKEMNLLLLKKIEELTLYIIQQNKKIAELEKQNLTLSQQSEDFKSLKAMLEELLERQKKE